MPQIIEALYENGVIKPLEKVEIKEGEKIIIRISRKKEIEKLRGKYKILEKIDKDKLVGLRDEIHDRRSHFC